MNELFRYVTIAVSSEWRRCDPRQREADKAEFVSAVSDARVNAYSLVGMRADADLLLWAVGDDLESLRALEVRLAGTRLWAWSTRPHVVVYPMTKKRSWYVLPHEERARIMAAHFAVGHRYPTIRIHTGYSFGIDDQEFVVAFECDDVRDFLALVADLRETESSSYTERETPIFVGRAMPLAEALDELDGVAARIPAT